VRTAVSLLAATVAAAIPALSPAPAAAQTWRLPWPAGQAVYVTQDCNDSCCNDHVGHNAYAWDFAVHGAFDVVAPRAGTVVHVKMSSNRGGEADAVDAANYIVLDHGDGTYSVMLHLARGSLDPAVRCGDFVRAGQRLAVTGSTGWSSGNHLHYQVSRIPPYMPQICECGPDGMACGEDEAHWELFWSNREASQTVPVQFSEWAGASMCGDRHDDNVLVSRNVDAREEVITIDDREPGRFVPVSGTWTIAPGGVRGTFRQAAGAASARISFAGRVTRPGLYEIWHALPAPGRHVGVPAARVEVVAAGGRTTAVQTQNVPGGGFHPLPGWYKLTGREGEGIVLASDGLAGTALAVDAVVLRRVGDVGTAVAGAACTSSAQCVGELVCAAGQCRAPCDAASCGPGATCDATGLCTPAAPPAAVASAPVETPRPPPPAPPANARAPAARQEDGGPAFRAVPAASNGRPRSVSLGDFGLFAGMVSVLFGLSLAARRREP
jgi:hypothetical protein